MVDQITQAQLFGEEEMGIDLENHRWRNRFGELIPVKEMSVSYIQNCIRAFQNGIIPKKWHGGWKKWKIIFEQELINRQ